jgi:putative membrane protein
MTNILLSEVKAMKFVLAAAMGAATLLAGCASTSEDMGPPIAAADPISPLSAPGYMSMAASSDMFEIESSRIALQRSQNPAVRNFAQMMIDHHSRTTSDLMATAQRVNLPPPPPAMLPPQRDALERVRAAGPDFDSVYKREQIMGHQMALDLHRNYAAQGDLPPFRDLASRTVPIIQEHLGRAQSLPEYAAPSPATPLRSGERG